MRASWFSTNWKSRRLPLLRGRENQTEIHNTARAKKHFRNTTHLLIEQRLVFLHLLARELVEYVVHLQLGLHVLAVLQCLVDLLSSIQDRAELIVGRHDDIGQEVCVLWRSRVSESELCCVCVLCCVRRYLPLSLGRLSAGVFLCCQLLANNCAECAQARCGLGVMLVECVFYALVQMHHTRAAATDVMQLWCSRADNTHANHTWLLTEIWRKYARKPTALPPGCCVWCFGNVTLCSREWERATNV